MYVAAVRLSVCMFVWSCSALVAVWRVCPYYEICQWKEQRCPSVCCIIQHMSVCMLQHSTHIWPFICCIIQHMSVRLYVAAVCLSVCMLQPSLCLSSSICPSGAAFVRLSSRAQALQAITALHQSQTMPVSRVHVCVCVCMCVCVCRVCECVCQLVLYVTYLD